jgi:hypothetical protein
VRHAVKEEDHEFFTRSGNATSASRILTSTGPRISGRTASEDELGQNCSIEVEGCATQEGFHRNNSPHKSITSVRI